MHSDRRADCAQKTDRFRAALEASCIMGAWQWDHVRGQVVYDDGAARLLTGNSEFANRPISGPMAMAAVHPDDLVWLMDHMLRAVHSSGLVLAEYRVFKADGSVRWLLSRGRTSRDSVGQPVRSHGILMDITEIRDGGDRYVLGSPSAAVKSIDRMVDLAIALKQTLSDEMPAEVHATTDLLLFNLGHAIARTPQH